MWDLVKVTFCLPSLMGWCHPSSLQCDSFSLALSKGYTHKLLINFIFSQFFLPRCCVIFPFFFSWSCCAGFKIKAYRFTDPFCYISAIETNVRSSLTALMGHTHAVECTHIRTHTKWISFPTPFVAGIFTRGGGMSEGINACWALTQRKCSESLKCGSVATERWG